MKSLIQLSFCLISATILAQSTTAYLYDGIANNWSGMGVSAVFRTLGTASHKFEIQANFTGSDYYKVNNQSDNLDNDFNAPSGSKVWSGGLSINTQGTTYAYGDGNGGANYYPVINGKYYSFCWEDVMSGSNAEAIVMETSASPVTMTSISQMPGLSNVHQGQDVTVSVDLSASLSAEENLFLRYSDDGFASYGTLISPQAGGASTKTFIIPSQLQGTNIEYYVFSTTLASSAINSNSFKTDLGTLNYINNGGSNYSYTVQATLPVELYFFNAELKSDKVQVSWATASESNNDFFAIERSNNAKTWQVIGELSGNGTSMDSHLYNFIDVRPLNGISYYRLGQYDFNKKVSYSNLVPISRLNAQISLYPNPICNILNISNLEPNEEYSIFISFLIGKEIQKFRINAETNHYTLHLNNLPVGSFNISIKDITGNIIYSQVIFKI